MHQYNVHAFTLAVPEVRAEVSSFGLQPRREVGPTDGGDVVQQEVQTVVICNDLRSHTILRYLCAESV